MSILQRTKVYATEVAEAALNAFSTQARGSLPSPDGAENVRLFTAKGGSAVTLSANTTSACVVYDPEASLRNGQLNVVIHERDSSDAIVGLQSVNLGRPSSEFISVGLLSSGLKVFNSSGVDVIGGTQSAAVLSSVPRSASLISSTDLANFTTNHSRDLASGVVSREDSTMTMSLSNHYGSKMCLARTNTLGNVVQRSWDDGQDNRRTTAGESLGPITNQIMSDAGSNFITGTPRTDAQIIAGLAADGAAFAGRNIIDTNNLTEANNPLTLATYNVRFECSILYEGANATDPDYYHDYRCLALDAADNVIASKSITMIRYVTAPDLVQFQFAGILTSTTVPISRVIVALRREGLDQANLDYRAGDSTATLTCFEETADIPARPIHVTVLEGLNASATININSFAVLTGVPDSTNVFISSGQSTEEEVYDYNAVEIFLRSITKVMPRAFTVSGHGYMTEKLTGIFQDEQVDVAFQAMSFGDVASRIKSMSKAAQKTAKELSMMVEEVEPMARKVATGMSMLPGPAGTIGSAYMRGSDMHRRMRGE